MNTIYKSILVLGVGLISVSAVAQRQDSTLSRQVLLERDYNPTLNEATKINTAPNIFTPKIQPASGVKFIDQAPELSIAATRLGQVASGDIRTEVPFSKERVYLNIGAGSHGNIDGAVGVRAVDTENDKLDLSATYDAADGNVDYAHSKNFLKKVKAKYSDLKIKLDYEHQFEPFILSVGGSYQNMGYNYYGNPLGLNPLDANNPLEMIDLNTKQKVDIISFGAGFRSSDKNTSSLKYEGKIGYTNFKSKYGFMPAIDKGPRGGIIEADVNFYTALGIGNIGVAGGIMNQTFSSKNNYDLTSAGFESMTNVTVNPYYKIGDLNWDVTLGANLNYVNDHKNKFLVTPNITAQIHINEVNTLYGNIVGGVNNNTFVDIIRENRYASPMSRVAYSKTNFDINAGFKSGVVPNLEFEIFGGYKQTKDDHMYSALSIVDMTGTAMAWGNVSNPIYAKISTGHFGGLLKTKIIPMTTLSAKVVGYFYNVKDASFGAGDKAWGRPNFTAELTADVQPIDKLTLSLSYLLMGGRKGYSQAITVNSGANPGDQPLVNMSTNTASMKDINEFNIRAEYEIIKCLSVHARVNNVFNQKYERQFGYTLQGINVLGGFNLKF